MNHRIKKFGHVLACPGSEGTVEMKADALVCASSGEGKQRSYPYRDGKVYFTEGSDTVGSGEPISWEEPDGKKILLDLGCGKKRFKKEGYRSLGLDLWEKSDADVIADAFHMPLRDNSVDYIYSRHFFEHFTYEQLMELITECKRVLKPEGTLHVTVPHYSCNTAFLDPTHRSFFAWRSFYKFEPLGLRVDEIRLHWMTKHYSGKIKWLAKRVSKFFSKRPHLERYCSMIGGMYEIECFWKVDEAREDRAHKDGAKLLN